MVIIAEGEYQASTKLSSAAEILQQFPMAMQLRFLQTVSEVAAENNSTTIFPIPMELFAPLLREAEPVSDEARTRALQAAAQSMVEALPSGSDGETPQRRGTLDTPDH